MVLAPGNHSPGEPEDSLAERKGRLVGLIKL